MNTHETPVSSPYSGEVIGTVKKLGIEDVDGIVAKARLYRSHLSGFERYEILSRVASAVKEEKREYAELISQEIGISMKHSLHEVDRAVVCIQLSAEEAKRIDGEIMSGEVNEQSNKTISLIVREPVGVLLCITPFNHPLNQVVHKVCPALAANNKVILKPSEKSPLTAIRFVELLKKCGFPGEMIQVVTGDNEVIGDHLIGHSEIDMISFTGSTRVGEYITRKAGIKKLSLELGGNDVFVVMPDANIEESANIAVAGAFWNSGQRCSSIKRIIVFPENKEAFEKAFVKYTCELITGDPFDENTDIGTVVDQDSAKEIESRINSAVEDGALLLTGGDRENAQIHPSILTDVKAKMKIVAEETFGPVAPIFVCKDIDEAIEVTNDTPFGLNAGIMTESLKTAFYFARNVNVGGVRINQAPSFRNEFVPFGGNKQSGFGRSGVKNSILEMTNQKTIIINNYMG